jgi:homoserine kinase
LLQSVTVSVPATSANLGPGFDCLGLALSLRGRITVAFGNLQAPDDPMATMARTAARRVLERAGRSEPVSCFYEGEIPLARGLGASAVARIGGLVAANMLAGEPLDREELLNIGTELEGHADNAAPALFGGLQVSVVEPGGRVLHTAAPLPSGLHAVLLIPEVRIATKDARRVLPPSVSRADAAFNVGRSSLFVAAMARGRFDLLEAATQDRMHQPHREKLLPVMPAAFEAARAAGAHAAFLSGSGSTLCALATAEMDAIAAAMLAAAHDHGVEARTLITTPSEAGAEVIEER